jgi:hypothetical protein
MSANNIPNKLPSVERLIQKVTVAERSNQRELRMTIAEARELVTDLTIMTTKMSEIIIGIHSRLDNLSKNTTGEIKIETDGGPF